MVLISTTNYEKIILKFIVLSIVLDRPEVILPEVISPIMREITLIRNKDIFLEAIPGMFK